MKNVLAITLAVSVFWITSPSWAARGYKAPAVEVMALPKFCWAQFAEEELGPDFDIPRSCGVGMNHYCPGLLMINAAFKAKTKGERTQLLQRGLYETRYTLDWMKGYPDCPIRAHVEATLRRVQMELKLPTTTPPAGPKIDRGAPSAPATASTSPLLNPDESSGRAANPTISVGQGEEVGVPASNNPTPAAPDKPGKSKNPNCRFCPD